MQINAIYLGVFWMLYYTIHSALASHRAKQLFFGSMPGLFKWYRLFFSVFATLNFLLLAWFHYITPSALVFSPLRTTEILGFALAAGSGLVFIMALRQYDFRVWYVNDNSHNNKLITDGLNAVVRHPLYFAAILGLVALVLIFPLWKNLVFALVTLLYIVIGALWEEQKLIAQYGDDYIAYRKKTKMLLPFLL